MPEAKSTHMKCGPIVIKTEIITKTSQERQNIFIYRDVNTKEIHTFLYKMAYYFAK